MSWQAIAGWTSVSVVLLAAIAILSGMLAAEHLYEQAATDCARFGGVPAATETLAYVCVPPR